MAPGSSIPLIRAAAVASLIAIFGACSDALGIPDPQPISTRASFDIDAAFIERLPRIDFVRASAHPDRDGWPAAGQVVTWRAHIRAMESDTVIDAAYRWLVDDTVVSSGVVRLPANGSGVVDLDRPW